MAREIATIADRVRPGRLGGSVLAVRTGRIGIGDQGAQFIIRIVQEQPQAARNVVLSSITAQFFVADLLVSSDFFGQRLGFKLDFMYGDPPFYAQMSRDEARIAFRQVDEAIFLPGVREREELLTASITVSSLEDIEDLFRTYEAARVPFYQPLKTQPWGARTFIVKDPDGNLILFAGPAEA